LLFLVPANSY